MKETIIESGLREISINKSYRYYKKVKKMVSRKLRTSGKFLICQNFSLNKTKDPFMSMEDLSQLSTKKTCHQIIIRWHL